MANKVAAPHFFALLSTTPSVVLDWARNVSTSLTAFFTILISSFNELIDEVTENTSDIVVLEGRVRSGTGSPEGVVTAPVGTLFLRDNGGASTTLYVKESGAGNTGWVGK